jgi:hypothetical protein
VEPSAARLGLLKPIEHVRQEFTIHALARVAYRDLHVRVDAFEGDGRTAAFRREFDGIRKEVPNHLLKPLRIAGHGGSLGIEHDVQADLLGVGGWPHDFHSRFDDSDEVDGSHLDSHLAGNDPRNVQQILNELGLRSRASPDRFQAFSDPAPGPAILAREATSR